MLDRARQLVLRLPPTAHPVGCRTTRQNEAIAITREAPLGTSGVLADGARSVLGCSAHAAIRRLSPPFGVVSTLEPWTPILYADDTAYAVANHLFDLAMEEGRVDRQPKLRWRLLGQGRRVSRRCGPTSMAETGSIVHDALRLREEGVGPPSQA
jgi:hypothetical protein